MAAHKRDDHNATLHHDEVHTILGHESSFEGKLIFDGTVRIDGQFRGEIQTEHTLVIGHTARIDAIAHVGSIIINGDFTGEIYAKHAVEIHAPGRMQGNIHTPQLMIAKGVIFEGSSKMLEQQAHPV